MYISLWIKLASITAFCATIVLVSVVLLIDVSRDKVEEEEKLDVMYQVGLTAAALQNQLAAQRQLALSASRLLHLREFIAETEVNLLPAEATQEEVVGDVAVVESRREAAVTLEGVFIDILGHDPRVMGIAYLNADGNEVLKVERNRETGIIAVTSPEDLVGLSDQSYVQSALELREEQVGVDVLFEGSVAQTFVYASPVLDGNGERKGLIVLQTDAQGMIESIFSNTDYQDIFLLDEDFRFLFGDEDVSILLNLQNPDRYYAELQPGVDASISNLRDVRGRELAELLFLYNISFDAANPDDHVVFGYRTPQRILIADYLTAARTVALGTTIVMISLLSFYFAILFVSTRALLQIYHVLRRYEAGDYAAEVTTIPQDELGRIAKAVNGLIETARNADKDRYDFINSASHQLRTPVSAIRMQIDTLKDDMRKAKVPRRIVNQVEDIEVQNRRSISVMNTLLKYLEIGEKYKPEETRKIGIEKMIVQILETHEEDIADKKLKVSVKIPPDISITGHTAAIRTTLNHLIANAIDYSHDGGAVEIRATKEGSEMVLSVSDEGIGIPHDEADSVFEKFFRASNAYLKRNVGSGLGLVIAKRVVEAHGGEIWFKSKEGEGTTFYISLPFG